MIYECSNHHRFEVAQTPARCSVGSCESRVLRSLAEGRAPGSASVELQTDRLGTAFRVLSAFTAGLALSAGLIILQLSAEEYPKDEPTPAAIGAGRLMFAALGTGVAALACYFVALYRSWELVQQGRGHHAEAARAPTPGKAVGLLFIPIFHLYWQFIALGALPSALSTLADAKHIEADKMSRTLALTCCWVDVFATLVPMVAGDTASDIVSMTSWLLAGAAMLLSFLFANQMFRVSWEIRRKLAR